MADARSPAAACNIAADAAAVLVAAGSGSRAGLAVPKQYALRDGRPLLTTACERLRAVIAGPIIVVVPAGDEDRARAVAGDVEGLSFCAGGATRQASVRAGLESLAASHGDRIRSVLIHDAARPDLPFAVVERLLDALSRNKAAIPVLPVVDSMVHAEGSLMGPVARRDTLRRVQTPQAFQFETILAAHRGWVGPLDAGDDAQVAQAAGHEVALVEGDEALRKLTHRQDFAPDVGARPASPLFRVGSGYDVHRLEPGDGVWLCGILVAHDRRLAGHSDADVALHALTDAILGGAAAGDIGQHFPPSDPQWRGAASHRFVTHAIELAREAGLSIANADVTIVCERPKIGPHRAAMQARLAELLDVDIAAVSVKATTTERLGFTGREEGIAAQAVVMLTGTRS